MRTKLIPAALFAAMIAPPAMACTDWKAVAAFDAIVAARDAAIELRTAKAFDDNTVCLAGWEAWWHRYFWSISPSEYCDPHSNQLLERARDENAREVHEAATARDKAAALADNCQENAR